MKELQIRFDVNALRPDRREEVLAWVRSLGLEPNDLRPLTLIAEGEHEYQLHVTRYLRTEGGSIRLDRAAEDAVTEPVIVGLGTAKSWPSWLGANA
ncbi:hypothetical protein ACQP1P_38530 [Dactylosporangium sp. CA-052675]|uniref:hypothetical protein n=1 Tax=Dactylosporangium sp. CA-052675 TaxID=3239927 RepID=UPI003D935A41